jgi:hypothetical protein
MIVYPSKRSMHQHIPASVDELRRRKDTILRVDAKEGESGPYLGDSAVLLCFPLHGVGSQGPRGSDESD